MEKNKLPRLLYNWISAIGAVIAAFCGLVIIFALILSIVSDKINPYLGILLYMVLPALLVGGLLMVPLGMYFAWRKRQATGQTPFRVWPSIDLNNARHRRAAVIFVFGTILFLLMSSVGMYQAYHFTESLSFCGLTCHTVMKPEYTAYQDSPHARVKCVECHIGPGAGWYARSKLSGLYQVYAVLANVYPRPIPTPIKDLRPAQETCEQCHWPRQFFGAKQKLFDHYLYDRANTHWPVNMLIKIGGGSPKTGQTAGIHWHMNIENKVEYIARDKGRQDIPWIRATDKQTGRVTVYQDAAHPLTQAELAAATPRLMDCMDCHNRPSHDFHSPDHEVDLAILTGRITPALPDIKKTVVNAMTGEYKTAEAAREGIARSITNYYRVAYPALYAQKGTAIHDAVAAAQEAYARNIFPAMRAKWSVYPDNIGHFIFPGCMRCHDGTHRSDKGAVIPHDCRTCHIILSEGPAMRVEIINTKRGLDFMHPVDIGSAWKDGTCYQCHNGTQP